MAEGKKWELLPQEVWGDGSGITFVNSKPVCRVGLIYYKPSTLWEHGGPLLDKHFYEAHSWQDTESPTGWMLRVTCGNGDGQGPTLLIASCRAIVAGKFGAEVQFPPGALGISLLTGSSSARSSADR